MARNLEAQLQAELIEEERLERKKEEEANIALIESWENTQAMMEADRLLAERLQTRDQEELTNEEKAKLFMELMEKRRKHFAALRAQEKRNRPQAQEISGKKDESSSKKVEIAQDSSAKRAWDKLESDKSKKQKTDENEEVEVDNEVELKMHMVTVKDDDIAIDAIPLATKPPVIVKYKLIREGIMGIDREDLQTLWKLVKTKHGDTRPEDEHERVLWGDLKVITAGTKVYAAGLQLLEELLLNRSRIGINNIDVMMSDGIEIDPKIQAEIDECFAYADALRDIGIDARVVVEAVDREESETGTRVPVKVTYETLGDLVQRFHDNTEAIPVHRIKVIEGVQREHGRRIVGAESAVTVLTKRVAELERDNRRLKDTASVEIQRVDRL
ncbi:hypothetical protein Tco_0529506 [Tanacetum coccineum]